MVLLVELVVTGSSTRDLASTPSVTGSTLIGTTGSITGSTLAGATGSDEVELTSPDELEELDDGVSFLTQL